MRVLLLGVATIVVCSLSAVDSWQQASRITDTTLAEAGRGTEPLTTGMTLSEQRYSPMAGIHPGNVGRLSLAWSYELDRAAAARCRWHRTSASRGC